MDDADFERLRREVRNLDGRLRAIELQGSGILAERIKDLRDDITEVKLVLANKADADLVKDLAIVAKAKADASLVQEMRDDTKSNRRIVLAAVVATAFSIGAWFIQWLVTRGHP